MHIGYKTVVLMAAAWLALESAASAQLFGARTVGDPVSKQAPPTAVPLSATSDTALKSARFLRQNRSVEDFVGVDPKGDARHIVGVLDGGQAAIIQSAVTDLRARAAVAASNRQLQAAAMTPNTRTAMNPPQLEISFGYSAPPAQRLPALLAQRLAGCSQLHAIGPIEVSMAGRTAIVRGTVASARDQFLAQQLLLFEPGISAVRNELQVQPPAADQQRSKATSSPAPYAP